MWRRGGFLGWVWFRSPDSKSEPDMDKYHRRIMVRNQLLTNCRALTALPDVAMDWRGLLFVFVFILTTCFGFRLKVR